MVTRSVTASSSNENNEENIIYVKTLNDGQNVVNVIPCDGMEVDDENSGQIQAEHVVEVDENGNIWNNRFRIIINYQLLSLLIQTKMTNELIWMNRVSSQIIFLIPKMINLF